MEPNAMPGGIYSNVQTGSMLGLEMSLLHHPPQNPHHHMPNYGRRDEIHHPQIQQPAKQTHPVPTKPQAQTLIISDDDDSGFASGEDGKRKIMSPWHRMKWTDNMVRLLIMVVFYIGDEVVLEANNNNNSDKKKVGGGGGGGISQKKGKWKSVSRAMMERGFYVSPQQSEDKFNDLNKRYKRVNDILGKGVSCRVVENQSLLETMDHISPKLKEEVRKLLNSKHLFFREMCAYHNNCGGGGGGVSGGVHADRPQVVGAAQPGKCLHSLATASTENKNNDNNNNNVVPNFSRVGNEGTTLSKGTSDDDDDDIVDDDDDDVQDGANADDGDDVDDDDFSDNGKSLSGKRMKKGTSFDPPPLFQLDFELANILEDGSKSACEKRQWMKAKVVRLEEERVGIQLQSFKIEKQRLKWLKFSGKKEREMERERLKNERLRLENERMVLIVRQKELDLIDHHRPHHHHHQYSSSNSKMKDDL